MAKSRLGAEPQSSITKSPRSLRFAIGLMQNLIVATSIKMMTRFGNMCIINVARQVSFSLLLKVRDGSVRMLNQQQLLS